MKVYTVMFHTGSEDVIANVFSSEAAAIYEVAAKKKKSDDEREPDYDTYYITVETV